MSVREFRGRPFGGAQIVDGRLAFPPEATAYYRGQDTPPLYYANGAIYVIHRDVVDKLNTQLFCAETVPFVMHGAENLDIDEPYDLDVARGLVASGHIRVPASWKPIADVRDMEHATA
jgi:CMP-N-acetylneuraminic acid synthetase